MEIFQQSAGRRDCNASSRIRHLFFSPMADETILRYLRRPPDPNDGGSMPATPTPKPNARSSARRSGRARRERNDRRAEARVHGKEDRRKKKTASIKKERRSGMDRREASRRRGSRRADKNRRHG
jgi:hypothetical protein